jgi:uncharacterized membrane protein YphA (DoxX/SURF4 family)
MESKLKTYLVLAGCYILSLVFFLAGGSKLMGLEMHIANFGHWGLPIWFLYVTGIVEVSGAILLLFKKSRFYGAFLIFGSMVGAHIIHITFAEYMMLPVPFVLLVLAYTVGWFHQPEWFSKIICAMPGFKSSTSCKVYLQHGHMSHS